ncbi:hypothetical protein [Burkholderia pseudomallei]|nr:hypothetical protein [Burkholderia pseudomallei]
MNDDPAAMHSPPDIPPLKKIRCRTARAVRVRAPGAAAHRGRASGPRID